jgi:hypothetical protein
MGYAATSQQQAQVEHFSTIPEQISADACA